jgi:hypothetical protein
VHQEWSRLADCRRDEAGLEEKTKKFVENGGEIYKSFNPLPRNPMSSGWHRTGSQCACHAVLESTVTARCPNE